MNTLILRPVKPSRKARWIPGQRRGNAVERKNLGLIPLVGEVLGALTGFLPLHVVKTKAGPRIAVTILHQTRDLKGGLVIEPEVTQALSTGKKDLHLELSGAGIVGKCVIAMTTFAPGAVVLKIR